MKSILLASLFAVAAAGAAFAQPPPTQPPVSDEALADKLTRDADLADQNRRSNALNVEINRKNRAVQARNEAAQAAYDRAMADYRAGLAAQDAANRKVLADYEQKRKAWEADVAACKAGDASRCAPPAAEPKTTAQAAAKPPAGKPAAP